MPVLSKAGDQKYLVQGDQLYIDFPFNLDSLL